MAFSQIILGPVSLSRLWHVSSKNKGYLGAKSLQWLCRQAGGAVPIWRHGVFIQKISAISQDTALWPLKSPHTWHLNAKFETYTAPGITPTRTPQWILSCCSSILTQKHTNIQMYVWHFHHDFQMNNSGLIFRGWHELNVHQSAPAISVWCAVCYVEWSTHGQSASLARLSLTFNVCTWNVWSLKIWVAT